MGIESMNFKKDSKKKPKKLKKALTLIEMIVVLMILTMITGALAYNYKEGINKGRKFKADELTARIKTAIEMAIADGKLNRTNMTAEWQKEVAKSPLIQNKDAFNTAVTDLKFVVTPENETPEDTLPFSVTHSSI